MRIMSNTRVITAQSIITNWNKSLYVTIGTSSFQRLGSWHNRPIGSPGKYIILSRCISFMYKEIYTLHIVISIGMMYINDTKRRKEHCYEKVF